MSVAAAPIEKKILIQPSPEYSENNVRLVKGGRQYFELLKTLINNASKTIHLQTYIYQDDATGKEIANALLAAASRGVDVYLLADGYASQTMSPSFIGMLRRGGVHFRFFEPIFKSHNFYFGRRLHHKIVVVDCRFALIGGVNISNKYNDLNGRPAWLDFALYAEGDIAKELDLLCYKTWKGFPSVIPGNVVQNGVCRQSTGPGDRCLVRMRRNDWVRGKNQVSASYIEMLKNARSEITILSSYFLPGRVIRKCLVQAAKRGIKIKVIVAGRSDIMLAKQAERFIYKYLLKNGIEIYEYQRTILHGKIAVCDNKWLTIGSYNLNNISAYASIELNLDVQNEQFAKQVSGLLNNIAETDCIRISAEYLEKRVGILGRIVHWASYQSVRFLFYMFTFYFKKRLD